MARAIGDHERVLREALSRNDVSTALTLIEEERKHIDSSVLLRWSGHLLDLATAEESLRLHALWLAYGSELDVSRLIPVLVKWEMARIDQDVDVNHPLSTLMGRKIR